MRLNADYPSAQSSAFSVCACGTFAPSSDEQSFSCRERRLLFLFAGKARLSFRGQSFSLSPFCVFFLPSSTRATLTLCGEDADCRWVSFGGTETERFCADLGFSEKSPLRTDLSSAGFSVALDRLLSAAETDEKYGLLSAFFALAALLKTQCGTETLPDDDYVAFAVSEIQRGFSDDFRIADLAERIGIDRSYLFRIFVRKTGVSPHDYLVRCRIDEACRLLCRTDFSVERISRACGFKRSSAFCNAFCAQTGLSPLQYRKRRSEEKEARE